ncbi:MAG: hypothetical protein R2702_12095 [Acidimicrobiales bacterium]
MSAEPRLARELWLRIETLHAVTYFGEETPAAARAIGLDGFWVDCFALRAPARPAGPAPSAPPSPAAPSFVRRWVPRCWELVAPDAALDVRSAAAAETSAASRRASKAAALAVAGPLDRAVADAAHRPTLLRRQPRRRPADDPVAALWQRCTTLSTAATATWPCSPLPGLSGLEAHVLIAAERGSDPVDLQRTRGWTEDDWAGAVAGLAHRGLVDGRGALRPAGAELRHEVEATTDRLAAAPLASWSDADASTVLDALHPVAAAVSAAGVLRYPNPIGLPPVGGAA